MRNWLKAAAAAMMISCGTSAFAGPFILDGTDADDHGGATATANVDGWLYIQRGLENIASSSSLTRKQKTIAVLGSDPNTQASFAVQSAVSKSAALSGWTVSLINGSAISDFFKNVGTGLTSVGASVIYMDSTDANVGGGLNGMEQSIIDANATNINNFLGSGGGLFSHAQGYGWLSALVPGLVVQGNQDQNINLTAAGKANFPGLSDNDLSAGPFHEYFTNTGNLPVLGVSARSSSSPGRAIILGGGGGTITAPTTGSVPEPASWLTMLLGFGMLGLAMRRAAKPALQDA